MIREIDYTKVKEADNTGFGEGSYLSLVPKPPPGQDLLSIPGGVNLCGLVTNADAVEPPRFVALEVDELRRGANIARRMPPVDQIKTQNWYQVLSSSSFF